MLIAHRTASTADPNSAKTLSPAVPKMRPSCLAIMPSIIARIHSDARLAIIDPATGDGIPSNPFYDVQNPRSARVAGGTVPIGVTLYGAAHEDRLLADLATACDGDGLTMAPR